MIRLLADGRVTKKIQSFREEIQAKKQTKTRGFFPGKKQKEAGFFCFFLFLSVLYFV